MNKELLYQSRKIFYRVTGKGRPVMLIHGFGEDGNVWKNQAEFLKNSFRLIIPDLPGTGKSELIGDMSIEGMAELIKAILDTEVSETSSFGEGLGKVCIIGHSMGGYITLAIAEKYPEQLNALGLFHSTAYADSEEKKEVRRKGIGFIRQYGAVEFLKTTIPNLFSPLTQKEQPELINEQLAGLDNFLPAALVSYYEAMIQRPDRTERLQNTRLPVLFIMGEYDNAAPLQDVLKQCHLPEKSYIYILRRSGHMGMLEEANKCNGILKKFLLEI